jgi:hypothetical protein
VRYLAVFAALTLLVFLSPLFCGGPQVHELGADRAAARHDREPRPRPDRPAAAGPLAASGPADRALPIRFDAAGPTADARRDPEAVPGPAPKSDPRDDADGEAEGLMVGPDGVIYRRESGGR